MLRIFDARAIITALVVVSLWAVVVVISGTGVNLFPAAWDFENTGQFGDSFGSLSAIMASLAALSALATFKTTRDEIERAKSEEAKRDLEHTQERTRLLERERSLDEQASKAEFERTFFQLVQTFNAIVSDTDYIIQTRQHPERGRDAFRKILVWFEGAIHSTGSHERAYLSTVAQFPNDLLHYFRFLYHVISFVHDHKNVDRYSYIRLVRALLSDAEIALLALNCLYGEGEEKFKPLVEEYALLHNISSKYKEKLALEGRFYARAFGRDLAPSRLP